MDYYFSKTIRSSYDEAISLITEALRNEDRECTETHWWHSLSAGGPLVAPDVPGLLVVPIGPHTLKARPVLLGAGARVTVSLPDPARASACVVVDGDLLPCRTALERVEVETGPTLVRLLRLDGRGFVPAVRDAFLT